MSRSINIRKLLNPEPKLAQSGSSTEESPEILAQAKLNIIENISPSEPTPGNTKLAYSKDKQPGLSDLIRNTTYEDAIRQSIADPNISYLDYKALESDSPITQQGYSGKTFSAPTIAAGGVVFPYNIIEKRERARAEEEKTQALEQLSMDYEIQEVKDIASNKIFINKQKEYYDGLAQGIADEKFDGNVGKAYQYLNKEKNTLAIAGLKWKNFKQGFDVAYENYLKLKADPASLGTSAYSKKTKEEMAKFEGLLDGNIDPNQIGELSKFINNFNKRATINEISTAAAVKFKDVYETEIKNVMNQPDYNIDAVIKSLDISDAKLENAFKLYGGDDINYTKEEKELFMESFRNNFEREIITELRSNQKFNPNEALFKAKATAAVKEAEEAATYSVEKGGVVEYQNNVTNEDGTTKTPNNLRVNNVVNLPSTTKKIQVSLQKDPNTNLQAIDKETGDFITTTKDQYFEPNSTYVAFVSDKDIYKPDPNTRKPTKEVMFKAGQPITADQEQLCALLSEVDQTKLTRVRYVQGMMTNDSPEPDERTSMTVIAPYSQVAGRVKTAYPLLDKMVKEADSKNTDPVILNVNEFNNSDNAKATGVTYTKAQLQKLFPQYIWLDNEAGWEKRKKDVEAEAEKRKREKANK